MVEESSDQTIPDEFEIHITTPLNACSLETLSNPVELSDGTWAWPMAVGCYELEESTGHRRGHLDLYALPLPEKYDNDSEIKMGLGSAPQTIFGTNKPSSGILDGTWHTMKRGGGIPGMYYATAHAGGEIQVHQVSVAKEEGEADESPPFRIQHAGTNTVEDDSGLCLSVSWDANLTCNDSTRIVSSYSNGRVAIHQATFAPTLEDGSDNSIVQLEEVKSWDAHKMFQCPAEVWCSSFTTNPDVILTGGDEGNLKLWDLRLGTASPMHVLKFFEAGVTVLSPHRQRDHLVACGSYDETMALLDLRVATESKPKPVCHSESLGGGVWRIKWHPKDDDRLLVAAMHGGCRVVKVEGLSNSPDSPPSNIGIQQEFRNHESMAYGADWLVSNGVHAAASCSFYDRALFLWKVKSP